MSAHALESVPSTLEGLVDPHVNKTARMLIATVITRPELLAIVPQLETDDFPGIYEQWTWQPIRNLQTRGESIEIEAIEAEHARMDRMGDTNRRLTVGREYLGELVKEASLAPDIDVQRMLPGWAASLRKLRAKKEAAIAAEDARLRTEDEIDNDALRDTEGLDASRVETPRAKARPVALTTIGDALEQLVKIGSAPVYPTPFPTLNEALGFGGMLGGQVYSLPGGTGRGKTSFIGQLAMHHATQGGSVLIAIYEAFAGYNVARMAAGPLGIHSNQIIRNVGAYASRVIEVVSPNIFFLDRPSLETLHQATDQIAQSTGSAPLVIPDYLQKIADLIQAGQQRPDARLATSQASAGLMDLALTTGSPVLAVSATSRVNSRKAQDPRKLAPYELVDVAKESGAVEYDGAGTIVLTLSDEFDGDERIATATMAKARYGIEMHIDMRFHGARGGWRDLGRVEQSSSKPRKSIEPPIRDAVLMALRLAPAESGTALAKRCGRNKKDVLAVIRELKSEDLVIETERGLEVAP